MIPIEGRDLVLCKRAMRMAGRRLSPGLIHGLETHIAAEMQTIEGLSVRDLYQSPWWKSLYGRPDNIRNCMRTIEPYLEERETLVKDNGELHQLLDANNCQPAA